MAFKTKAEPRTSTQKSAEGKVCVLKKGPKEGGGDLSWCLQRRGEIKVFSNS